MHKTLLILGLLRNGPIHGHELHRIVRLHGELYADLKKANLYYLLERLAKDKYLSVEVETGTRGKRGERLVYSLTDKGRAYFNELLREVIRSYEVLHTGVEVAVVFLAMLPTADAISLLSERHEIVSKHRLDMAAALGDSTQGTVLESIAADHMLSLIDAELAWLDRSIQRLKHNESLSEAPSHAAHTADNQEDTS